MSVATAVATFTVAVRNHRGSTEYFRGLSLADAKALHARHNAKVGLTSAEMFPTA